MKSIAFSRNAMQYVTLGIDHDVFAVDVDKVREILDMQPVSRVPNAPPFLVGVIDVRGQAVPVLDLRVKLGLPAVPPTGHTRIIVLEVGGRGGARPMGLITDRVFEVTPLADRDLEPPPEVGIRWKSDYIQAIGRHNGTFVIVFDLARLFSSEDSALADLAGSSR